MDVAATMTSKGQITVPKSVRDALGLAEGDQVVFRVEGHRAVMARTPDFLALAGTIAVEVDSHTTEWDHVRESTWAARARSRR